MGLVGKVARDRLQAAFLFLTPESCAGIGASAWARVEAPRIDPLMTPLLYAVVAKGTDVDQPRSLAKSVTVE